jgi:hypothetical protein
MSIRITSRILRKFEKINSAIVVSRMENVVIPTVGQLFITNFERKMNNTKKRSIIIIPSHPDK